MGSISPPVFLPAARDAAVRYLADPAHRRTLRERLAYGEGVYAAYAQAVAVACPDLSGTYYADVVDMVRRAIKAQSPRMIRRARRAA
jgi:hypothetical protein